MKFSDVTVVVVAVADLSIAIDRKTPIFNIAFAASNSNAKSNPEIKLFLTIFKVVSDDCGDFNDDGNNDLRFFFNR
jgi:hypothetical protein